MNTELRPMLGVLIQNDSGEDIPPRSIVVVTSVEVVSTGTDQESITVHHATKYTGQAGNIFVTDMNTIPEPTEAASDTDLTGRSIGYAYSDQFINVAIDPDVDTPIAGEQWGPVPSKWTIGRGGMGFFAQGYADIGYAVKQSIFRRDRGWCHGKLSIDLSAGTDAGVGGLFDVWHYDNTSGATPKPLIVSPNPSLLGLAFYNNDPSLEGVAGTYVKIEESQGVRTAYWVGCPT